MSDLSLQEARKMLGDDCKDISDEQLKEEIKTATLLKDIFFDMLKKGKLNKNK